MILKNVEKKENNTAAFVVETDAAEFAEAVNDAYLKSNGQSEGVISYNRFVELLLAFYSK